MKYEIREVTPLKKHYKFKDVSGGEVFKMKDNLYMKLYTTYLGNINTVSLLNGVLTNISDDQLVSVYTETIDFNKWAFEEYFCKEDRVNEYRSTE